MKYEKIKIIVLILTILIASCTKRDSLGKLVELKDFSGNFKIIIVNGNSTSNCLNSAFAENSFNDLEIQSNGRFKQKIYSLNSNNECLVSEILEGQITIDFIPQNNVGPKEPSGIVEYDNSNEVIRIEIEPSNDEKYNRLRIGQILYARSE